MAAEDSTSLATGYGEKNQVGTDQGASQQNTICGLPGGRKFNDRFTQLRTLWAAMKTSVSRWGAVGQERYGGNKMLSDWMRGLPHRRKYMPSVINMAENPCLGSS